METEGKTILDATCGGRMMWFNKDHPNAVYADQRREIHSYPDDCWIIVYCNYKDKFE